MENFLLAHGLNHVLSEINNQSKKNKKLVTKNFSFIEDDGETDSLMMLLTFLQENELVSFELILACFRVQDFEVILKHFEILLANDLISPDNLKLVLDKEEDLLGNPHHSGIIQKISEMISLVGIKDHDSLLRVWEHNNPGSLLYALELFSENDDIQLETVFKIAECLESESLVCLVNQIYDKENFDVNVVKEIALSDGLIDEKRERLTDYCNSLLEMVCDYAKEGVRSLDSPGANAFTLFAPKVTTDSRVTKEEAQRDDVYRNPSLPG